LLYYEYAIGDAQPLMLKMNYLSPLKKLASPLRAPRILFVDPGRTARRSSVATMRTTR